MEQVGNPDLHYYTIELNTALCAIAHIRANIYTFVS